MQHVPRALRAPMRYTTFDHASPVAALAAGEKGAARVADAEQRWRDVMLVGNPISGLGKARTDLQHVADLLRRGTRSLRIVQTTRKGDAQEAANDFGGDAIVAFGGDGTVNEVINGAHLDRCAVAVVPAGTGNVLAKELRMPMACPQAVRAILGGRVERLDLGLCNGRRFVSVFGAGLDAHVVEAVHQCRRKWLTPLHYVPHLLRYFLRPPHWDISVSVDGKPFLSGADVVCVGNARNYGGPVSMTSAASPTDGVFDVMALPLRSVLDAAVPAAAALLRSMHACPAVRYGRGRRVLATSSRRDVPWQVDGEVGGKLPAEIHIEPRGIGVIVPPAFRC